MLNRHLKPYLYYQKSIDLFETADDKAHIITIYIFCLVYIFKFSSINNALMSWKTMFCNYCAGNISNVYRLLYHLHFCSYPIYRVLKNDLYETLREEIHHLVLFLCSLLCSLLGTQGRLMNFLAKCVNF